MHDLTNAGSTTQSLLRFADKVPETVSRFLTMRIYSQKNTHQIAAHPSGSWKLSAMSVTLDSVHTIRVSVIMFSTRSRFMSDIVSYLVVSDIRRL
jgi:hypothetical protein